MLKILVKMRGVSILSLGTRLTKIKYVHFDMFWVKFGPVYRNQSLLILTLPNVIFCSLSVGNYQKTSFCLTFSDRKLQVLLLEKTQLSTKLSSYYTVHSLHKKWSFPLRISPVNVTKSAGNSGFGRTCCRNP